MNCREVRSQWSLYFDSEGEAELFLRINEHLGDCPECARWYEGHLAMERLIEQRLAAPAANSALWQSVLARSEIIRPKRSEFRLGWSVLAVAIAACLLLALGWLRTQEVGDNLSTVAIQYHSRLAQGQEPVDLTSQSDREVESYLRQRVPFPVRCPPRQDSGFRVCGAGVRRVVSGEMAYLVGTVENAPVSIFLFPREARSQFEAPSEKIEGDIWQWQHQGHELLLREFDGNLVVVVGRANRAHLRRVLRAYGSYPHAHG